ncbi:MAG: triphosphoribosyl-dephospho-CoA synthase [Methanohalobium sp.]|uniref:triphosphoribosyl-dephospho-CoA synthase n=1 Tax=Methanohalobium sp. TaxID=2837493 RepID=UPI00397DC0D4
MNFKINLSEDEYSGDKIAAHIARCAQLSMVLEVSSSPKPGNIDRNHNYNDTDYEHFLASAVSVYPVIEDASKSGSGIGKLIKRAVSESISWQKGGNTHFGAFILQIPLTMAAGNIIRNNPQFSLSGLINCAHELVRNTDTQDAVNFYESFSFAGVRVNDVNEFDLQDKSSINSLYEQNVTLYNLMDIAKSYDLIADEWTTGFKRCSRCADTIIQGMQNPDNKINDIIVYTFLKTLSENRDTFIETKFDKETAEYVSSRASEILSGLDEQKFDFKSILPVIQDFDNELLDKNINPGSTADIIIAGLFIALLGGIRF